MCHVILVLSCIICMQTDDKKTPNPVELEERARKGSQAALEGLTTIHTPEATQAIVRLLAHDNPAFALKVGEALLKRMPNPDLIRDKGIVGSPPYSDTRGARKQLIAAAWRPEFAPAVRKIATEWLASKDWAMVACGARMLYSVGEALDGAEVLRAVNRTLDDPQLEKPPVAGKIVPQKALYELEFALRQLVIRGLPIPPQPATPAEALAYAIAIDRQRNFHPTNWETVYASILQSSHPRVRVLSVGYLPYAIPDSLQAQLGQLLLDKDKEIQRAACWRIGSGIQGNYIPQLREVLRTAHDEAILDRAIRVAEVNKLERWEHLQLWISRLDEEGMTPIALRHLAEMVIEDVWCSRRPTREMLDLAAGRECKALWTAFLKDHEATLRKGKFKLGDPALKPELFPEFKFERIEVEEIPPELLAIGPCESGGLAMQSLTKELITRDFD